MSPPNDSLGPFESKASLTSLSLPSQDSRNGEGIEKRVMEGVVNMTKVHYKNEQKCHYEAH
jgi:hypothetical protein